VRGPGSLISYSELLQVDYDRPNLSFIVLIFRHVMVTVKGRNLDALFSGIQMRLTKAIQQHDPKKDVAPVPGALVVESIDFTYQRFERIGGDDDGVAKNGASMNNNRLFLMGMWAFVRLDLSALHQGIRSQ
jgi:hypothetical protein